MASENPVNVTVWNEYIHERENEAVASIYPDGIHRAVADGIVEHVSASCRTATLEDPDHGLTEDVLARTDVLVWWGHRAHDRVDDGVVARVCREVLSGMGLIVLHSGHESKVFRKLMGTNCSLKWREANERERLWNLEPAHPILAGIPDYFELESEEMYGERFDVPPPDELLMVSWFEGGEVFRSLCTWQRGHGKIVYFRPGHETYPTYHERFVRLVIANAAAWARRRVRIDTSQSANAKQIEPLHRRRGGSV